MILFVNPSGRAGIYQSLGDSVAALEPPLWCRLLSSYCERKGIETAILDADAMQMSADDVARTSSLAPMDLVVIVAHGHQPSASTQTMPAVIETCQAIKKRHPEIPVLIVGGHPAALPKRTLEETGADFVCTGEGAVMIISLYQKIKSGAMLSSRSDTFTDVPGLCHRIGRGTYQTVPAENVQNLTEEMPGGQWDKLPMDKYRAHIWHALTNGGERQPYASIYTSLGCPFSCLRGNTVVNTIYGDIPIAELADKYDTIPVYTYKNGEVFIAEAKNIRKIKTNENLVRVRFDDGSYIDCTPDHKFLTFKWGNGRADSKKSVETPIEAQNLSAGNHIRAIRMEIDVNGRAVIRWKRRLQRHRSRLVMDYLIGRKLTANEQVHHKDRNRLNDHPDNLEYCPSGSTHILSHHREEFSKRMTVNNPAKHMTAEWLAKVRLSQTGLKRSLESRLRYRESKLGRKNPNYKDGKTAGRMSRVIEINHRVVSVTPLIERDDVYCLEVPDTGWFFANNVLVKNCSFCMIQSPFREGDRLKLGDQANSYRTWSVESVIKEIETLVERYNVRNLKIADEMFILKPSHVDGVCDAIIERGYGDKLNIWCYGRVDCTHERYLDKLRRAGVRWIALGIEAASPDVRDGVEKAGYDEEDIFKTCERIRAAGINVMGNFMVGLPSDTEESIERTVDLALAIRPEFINVYAMVTYPGTPLWDGLPEKKRNYDWKTYGHHSYEYMPTGNDNLSPAKAVWWRDEFFQRYFTDQGYLAMIERKFGLRAVTEIEEMARTPLKRKLFGD